MTWWGWCLLAAAASAAFFAGMAAAHRSIDSDDYWAGFADGELHQQLEDRTPSLN